MTKVADLQQGETTTMAPFVVKDRVIVGPSGGEFGIHGWVKALDLKTGSSPGPRTAPDPTARSWPIRRPSTPIT